MVSLLKIFKKVLSKIKIKSKTNFNSNCKKLTCSLVENQSVEKITLVGSLPKLNLNMTLDKNLSINFSFKTAQEVHNFIDNSLKIIPEASKKQNEIKEKVQKPKKVVQKKSRKIETFHFEPGMEIQDVIEFLKQRVKPVKHFDDHQTLSELMETWEKDGLKSRH